MIEACGITEADQGVIIKVVQGFEEIEELVLYGSAKSNLKIGSDIDLAIKGALVTSATSSKLHYELNEETTLPYFFDVTDYEHLTHPKLKEHIDRVGKSFYQMNQNQ